MNFSVISKYRQELMGIAILQVMLMHIFTLNGFENRPSMFDAIVMSIYTSGFLFLSGFSNYYSIRRDNRIGVYYLKRMFTIFIPYLIVVLPYYTYAYLSGQMNLVTMIGAYHECGDTESYLGFLSTFGYWYVGNYNGMWYVAVIVLLYLMYPLVNRTTDAIATFITKRNNHKYASINGGLIINVLAITAIYFIISRMTKLFPEYLMNNGISLAPFFFTGSLFAHMAYKEESVKYSTILILCMISIIIGPANFRTLFAILFSCYMFELFKIKDTKILALLRWFGKYTFELYIVHLNLYFFCSSMDLLPLKNGVANTLLVYLVAIPIAVAVHNVSKRIKDCILKNFKVVAK